MILSLFLEAFVLSCAVFYVANPSRRICLHALLVLTERIAADSSVDNRVSPAQEAGLRDAFSW